MMWMAAGAVAGAAAWRMDTTHALHAGFASILLIIMLAVVTPRLFRPLLFAIGLGLATTSAGIHSSKINPEKHVVGMVIERTKYGALIRSTQGHIRLRATDLPLVGEWITAWIQPDKPAIQLPGEFSSAYRQDRRGVFRAKAIAWAKVDGNPPDPQRLAHLRHGPMIEALGRGDKSQVPDSDIDLMRRTGTIHLLAISGLHIGMVAAMGAAIGWIGSRPLVVWPVLARLFPGLGAITLAVIYGQIVGWPVSTRRAAIMVAIGAIAHILGRGTQPWHLWSMALLLVIVLDPAQVESIGCWMSFGSVAALIGWMPLWSGVISPQRSRVFHWVWNSIGTTTVATLGTLPVTAWIFQYLGLGAPLANLLAVPLFAGLAVPAAMIGIHGPTQGAEIWLQLADTVIGWSMQWMRWSDLGSWTPAVGPAGACLLGVSIFLYRWPRWALLLCVLAFVRPSEVRTNFEIVFPAIGQGGAALVSFPDGRHWLIDGGPPGHRLLHWLRRRGIRKLDAVFLSHPDIDHLGGITPVIQSLEVDTLWAPRRPRPDEKRFHALWRNASQKGVRTAIFGPDPHSEHNDNDDGLVIRLRHGEHQFLLLGDIGTRSEHRMLLHLEQMTVVQIPHHGSNGSSSESLIAVTNPLFAVAQAGPQNQYGHPHSSVIDRWGPHRVLRTDRDGAIRIVSDGQTIEVSSWNPQGGWQNHSNSCTDHVDTPCTQG